MIRYDAFSAFLKPRALCFVTTALSLALSGALERRAEASHAQAGSPAKTTAIKPDGAPSVAVLELAEHGQVAAVEVMRTPGVWEGRIVGDTFGGGVVMRVQTTVGEVLYVQGNDGSVLQSLPADDGSRRVHLRSNLPGCGGAIAPDKADWGAGGAEGSIASNCDDGSVLDVLVKWTPTAEAEAGGPTAIRAVAEAAIAMSNHVYLASGVNVYIRGLGYSVTEPYDGDASATVLGDLAVPYDGRLDSVHAERDALGADLVALLSGHNPSTCGMAFILGNASPAAGFSFSVWQCGGLIVTHEIGHNQGCCHAPGDGGGCSDQGVFPYSVGHRFIANDGNEYRTVLAYSPGIRIPRLSSPTVQYIGTPTGLPEADNARTVRETAAVMASYRCMSPCADLPLQIRSPMLVAPTAGGTVTFSAPDVPYARAGSQVEIVVSAAGDLNALNETLSLRIGSTDIGMVAGGSGTECRIQSRTTSVPASVFNGAIGGGAQVAISVTASTAVDACAVSELSLEFRYATLLGRCAGDLDGDGSIGGFDLSAVLSAWGECCGCTSDINGDGLVDGSELTLILSGWGACAPVQPTLTSVAPASGPVVGGTTITLTGTNLTDAISVTVGGAAATNVQVVNETTVTAVTPAGTAGARDVTVTTSGGTATRTGGFTYVVPAPTLSAVSPASGPTSGGTTITLTGTNLTGASLVRVGGTAATSVQVVNATTVTAVTPAGTAGARDVAVTTPGGTATRTGGFTYATATVPSWATLLEPLPDPTVVTDATLRSAITATGYAWRVRGTDTQIEFVLIPPGTFQMGCSASNQYGCSSDGRENPVHTVTLTNAFYMGRYEVTQAQWTSRMGSNPSGFQSASAEVPLSQVPNRPVERVSWNTIQGFLSATGMRLPTEAEWEYAYRAGTTTAFHSMPGYPNGTNDDNQLGAIAWFRSNSASQTRPVGQLAGNGFGLHDMSGNVWEWVNDWFSQTYYVSSPSVNPPGPSSSSRRVLRGGSWDTFSNVCRSSYRGSLVPSDDGVSGNNYVGFRVARNP